MRKPIFKKLSNKGRKNTESNDVELSTRKQLIHQQWFKAYFEKNQTNWLIIGKYWLNTLLLFLLDKTNIFFSSLKYFFSPKNQYHILVVCSNRNKNIKNSVNMHLCNVLIKIYKHNGAEVVILPRNENLKICKMKSSRLL